jgi:hypothetical protein
MSWLDVVINGRGVRRDARADSSEGRRRVRFVFSPPSVDPDQPASGFDLGNVEITGPEASSWPIRPTPFRRPIPPPSTSPRR